MWSLQYSLSVSHGSGGASGPNICGSNTEVGTVKWALACKLLCLRLPYTDEQDTMLHRWIT